ncbi:MAG: hypothetical protein JNN11_00260 [Candidatus Doudnabacteria bacterium]|nr:hypothetical protein [Candidatus Doudnabacteria bacterium]
MDQDKLRNIYQEKYEKLLNLTFEEWMDQAPQTEDQAYEILEEINEELKKTQDDYDQAEGDSKWELGDYREMLHNKYQLIEEMFGLEPTDE